MEPRDPRYLPQLEIVPVEPAPPKREGEDIFWEKNAHVPIDEILKERSKPKTPAN